MTNRKRPITLRSAVALAFGLSGVAPLALACVEPVPPDAEVGLEDELARQATSPSPMNFGDGPATPAAEERMK